MAPKTWGDLIDAVKAAIAREDWDEGEAIVEHLRHEAEHQGDSRTLASAALYAGIFWDAKGDLSRAEASFGEALNRLALLANRSPGPISSRGARRHWVRFATARPSVPTGHRKAGMARALDAYNSEHAEGFVDAHSFESGGSKLDNPSQSTNRANGTVELTFAPSTLPRRERALRGEGREVEPGLLALIDALLKAPASVLREVERSPGTILRLATVTAIAMMITGLSIAAISGGWQLVLVPLKLTIGIFVCALICLPSLHVFSCLAGAEQSVRETWGALSMGIALMGVLLVGLAPIGWVLSQASATPSFLGALQLVFLAIGCTFALRLIHKALAALNAGRGVGLTLWSVLFVLVILQMTTTLRPIVGPYDGQLLHERMFFLKYWLSSGRS